MGKVEDIVGRYAAKCREMADNGDDPRFEWWDGLADLIQSQQALIEEMREALIEAEDYFDNLADADCDQDGYIPNKEMTLLVAVRKALSQKE